MRKKQQTMVISHLDLFRLSAAAFVVAIHTSPLMSFHADADFFLTRVLARIAVPFFFMVTGQFVVSDFLFPKRGPFRAKTKSPVHNAGRRQSGASQRNAQQRPQAARVWAYEKKLALLYAGAIIIYIPIGIYAGQYKGLHVIDVLRMLLFDGTFYHLWYFPACMLGVLLVYAMSRVLEPKQALAAAGVLYIIGLFGDSYYGLIENLPVLSGFYEALFLVFSYTRNGIFLAPFFLILGAMAAKRQAVNVRIWRIGLVISFLGMTEEAFLLRHFELQRHDSMYFMLVPVMVFFYDLLSEKEHAAAAKRDAVSAGGMLGAKQISQMLRTTSTWIYILHPAFIVLVRGAAKVLGMSALLVENSLVHYLVVFVCSLGAAVMIALWKQRASFKKDQFHRGRAWMELDHKALQQNVDTLRAKLPAECRLMPAVKADAYGHGAGLIAKELQKMGIDSFCAACVQEGVDLRRQGIRGDILILGYTHPEQFALLHRYHLTQTVIDYAYAQQLNRYGGKIHVHIGIDTGMHRLGERSENIEQILAVYKMKHLIVDGLFTHLCASDTKRLRDKEFTDQQAETFYEVIRELKAHGCPCPKIHMQASYGVLNYPQLSGDYARVGIALYGVLSTKEDTQQWQESLHPVLSLKARVAAVKTLYEGESAGYGLQFTAGQDMKIATLAIGYADGLPRALSGGVGSVLIHGQKAPVIGRICMDQTIVDVSGIDGVRAGDTAVLIGHSGDLEISVCDLAQQAGTITNEILSRMGARLERVVV